MSDLPPMPDEFSKAVHRTEKAKVFDQQMHGQAVMMGLLDESQISSILAMAAAKIKKLSGEGKGIEAHSTKDILFQVLLQYIEDLDDEIAKMEAAFDAENDAWREELALKILNADDIPQQRPGESIEEYRERLEAHLINELLNEDGTIKGKYKNDPALAKYAQWAQKNYNRDAARGIANDLKDPATTHPQTGAILNNLEEAKNSEVNLSAADALEGYEAQQGAVLYVDDNLRDDGGDQERTNTAASSFLNLAQ